jgi:copper chaperone
LFRNNFGLCKVTYNKCPYIHVIITGIFLPKEVVMAETRIAIEGMSCQHCVMAVRKALGGLPGILESNVQIGSAVVKYDENKVNKDDIEAKIEDVGYKIVKK